jgi:hypothetical protein
MTTNYHTPYVDGTTKFRQTDMNAPLGELDAEITKRASTHQRSVCIVPFESDADVATGDGKVAFTVPASMTSHDLKAALASVHTQGVTGTLDIQIRRRRAGTDVDMLSTKITVGAEYYAADGVVNTSNDDIQTGDQIYIDVDAVHSGTAPKGLSVTLTFEPQ